MADLNAAVYTALQNDAPLTALVGTKVWNSQRTMDEGLPALVFQRITTTYVAHSAGTDGLAGVLYQLDAYASTLADASAVALAAQSILASTFNAVSVSRVDSWEDQTRAFRVTMDVSVWGTDE